MNNILHLKYAVEIEKTGSISKAAENLYMSQPHLSKAIRDLEDSLGIVIFRRSPRGVAPTEQGTEFLTYAKSILSQIAEMESLYRKSEIKKERFDLAVPRASYISHAFTETVKALPQLDNININYRETNSVRAIKNVSDGINNLAIVRYQTIYEMYYVNYLTELNLQYQPIWEFHYLALMSKAHPLAQCDMIDFHALAKYIEIIHGDISVPSLPIAEAREMAAINEEKKSIAIYERGSQFELLSHIPTTFMWVSPMPQDVLDCFSLVQKPCNMAKNKFKDVLIYREGYHFSKIDSLFISKLNKTVKQVSQL